MKFRNPATRAFGWLLVFPMLLVVGGCNDDLPTAPVDIGGDVEGVWDAVSLGGNQMPLELYVEGPDQGTCRLVVERVTLTFVADSTYSWVEDATIECQASPPSPSMQTSTGTYRIEGVKLFMTDPEAGTSELESSFSVEGSTLTMRQRVGSGRVESIFQRT